MRSQRLHWPTIAAVGIGAALRTAILAALLGLGCASEPAPQEIGGESDPAEQMRELEAAIARDHAILQSYVSRPREETDRPLYEEPEIRSIARRLGAQERELERLRRAQRAHPATLR
ncbi:MAG: hypothetical protein JRG86_01065 [Deltaproteobacteria bacterium]|jgi:hypothetical protein|nr:hypothetical protein [Deltaproteobacteria bacterium]MBW2499125.1 hypothetical protein [Deltaproteobacteria bacterium]